jgi:RNA polymerase sigma factor (sigma-70 family)
VTDQWTEVKQVTSREKGAVARRLRTLLNLGITGDLSDGQLLQRFTTRDGEPAEQAFRALVERHGRMVLRVCEKLLGNSHDAQDAFQATFLVLVQKARRLWVRDSLGPWLHRVAYRVAARARASRRQRRATEQRVAAARPAATDNPRQWDDLEHVLHEEIDRLPDRYAVPVVLCHLEGLSHERAARLLGLPVGSLKSRLRRARELLRGRMSRRGLTLPAGLLIADATSKGAEAAVPLALVHLTVRGAVAAAMGQAAALEAISASTVQLTDEVLRTMFMTKLKMVPVVVLMLCALAAGAAGVLAQHGSRPDRRSDVRQPKDARPDVSDGTLADDSEPVPSFIRQSRVMIITRLEQELSLARGKLDRTLQRVRSENDPEVAQARRTVDSLEQLLARIDTVLVEAVDRYPTIFDFSSGPSEPPRDTTYKKPPGSRSGASQIQKNNGDSLDESEFVTQRGSSKQTQSQGQPGSQEFDRESEQHEATIARAAAEVIRTRERVEWARRMLEKGFASKNACDAAVLDHEAAVRTLRAIGAGGSRAWIRDAAQQPGQSASRQNKEQQGQQAQSQNSRQGNSRYGDQSSDTGSKRQNPGQPQQQKQSEKGQPDHQSKQSQSGAGQHDDPSYANIPPGSQSAGSGSAGQGSKAVGNDPSGATSNRRSQKSGL